MFIEIDKSTSEEHFIRVIYDHLLENNMAMEQREQLARFALDLHKQYWEKCEHDLRSKAQQGVNELEQLMPLKVCLGLDRESFEKFTASIPLLNGDEKN